MAMTEKAFENKCCELAVFDGWFERKVEWGGRKGAPDRVFIKNGRVVWCEFKRPDGSGVVSTLQENEHERMRKAGAEVYVIESYPEFRAALGIKAVA